MRAHGYRICPLSFLHFPDTAPHLVEFVDKTHALVRKDESSSLKGPLLGERILVHPCRQPHRRRTLSRGVHSPGSRLLAVLQYLDSRRALRTDAASGREHTSI